MRISKYTTTLLLAVSLLFVACDDQEQNEDMTPPGVLTDVQYTPTNGGAVFSYNLPADDDILCVKAYYTNTLGEDLFKVSSHYIDDLEIDGYNDTDEHTVSLVVVDRSKNESDPVNFKFRPLESNIQVVLDSMKISPDYGGVRVEWVNPAQKTVYTHLSYTDTAGREITEFLSSSRLYESFVIRGMDTTSTEFFTLIEDFYGNKTDKESQGEHTPLFEERVDFTKWTMIPSLSVDAVGNVVDGNAWEGSIEYIWDGKVDVYGAPDAERNYAMFNREDNGGALNFPLDVVLDLGNDNGVFAGRVVLWQRAYYHAPPAGKEEVPFYYQDQNIKAFKLYYSNDQTNWYPMYTSVDGEASDLFDIGDPKDENGDVSADDLKIAEDGHGFEIVGEVPPFRYLKFSITENYGSEIYVNVSELALFGGNY